MGSKFLGSILLSLALSLFSVSSFSAPAAVTEEDFKLNLYETLGIDFDLLGSLVGTENRPVPSEIEIIAAYKNQLRAQHPDASDSQNSPVSIFDASKLRRVKDILTNPELKTQYLQGFFEYQLAQPLEFKGGSSGQIEGFDPRSIVGELKIGKNVVGIITANTGHLRPHHSIPYLRANPNQNHANEYNAETPAWKSAPSLVPEGLEAHLDPKWTTWSQRSSIGEIEAELKWIADNVKTVTVTLFNSHPDRKRAEAFLYWWFSQPASLKNQNLAIGLLKVMSDNKDVSSLIMKASVSNRQWRNQKWIKDLLRKPGAFFALASISGTDEVISNVELIESIMALEEAKTHYHYLWDFLLPRLESANHPEWVTRFLDPNSKASNSIFLRLAADQPHWRNRHPNLITESLKNLARMQTGSMDQLVYPILARKDSYLHPEWLEIFVKAFSNNYLNIRLQHVLAMDQWFSHPYLKLILKGRELSVDSLQQATWLRVAELPNQTLRTNSPLKIVSGSCRDAISQ